MDRRQVQALRSSGQKLVWLWKNLSLANVSKCHGDSPQELWQTRMRKHRCTAAPVTQGHLVFLADVPNGHRRNLDTWALKTKWSGSGVSTAQPWG